MPRPWQRPLALAAALAVLVAASCTGEAPTVPPRWLRVDAVGDGRVWVDDRALALPFEQQLRLGQTVRLRAEPGEGQRFVGWEGDLGTSDNPIAVRLMVDEGILAVARFAPAPAPATLVVAFAGGGSGRVWSDPTGLDCTGSCTATFAAGDAVTLDAEPAHDAYLRGWAGCDAGGPDALDPVAQDACRVTLEGDRAVWALIEPLATPAPNDVFADRTKLVGARGVVRTTNALAGAEPGEPRHGDGPARRSLWWTWTAEATGPVRFDARASGVRVAVAAYRGDDLASLRPVTDFGTDPAGTRSFRAVAGATYAVAVDATGEEGGFVRLAWSSSSAVQWSPVPDTLRLEGDRGAAAPDPVTVTLANDGDARSGFRAEADQAWLEVRPAVGVLNPGERVELTLTVDACDVAGVELGTLTIAGGGAEASVRLERACAGADWRASPSELTVAGTPAGGAPGGPVAAAVTLRNLGTRDAVFSTRSGAAWLTAAPADGVLRPQEDAILALTLAPCASPGVVDRAALEVVGGGHTVVVPVARDCREMPAPRIAIDRAYVNQAVPAGDTAAAERIPLVAGRAGLLRAFVRADAAGLEGATVVARYRVGLEPERVLVLDGPTEVPGGSDEGDLGRSYAGLLPASAMTPDLELVVEAQAWGPDGALVSARYPHAGSWRPTVAETPPLPVTLVPIAFDGGPVPVIADAAAYLDLALRAFPLAADAIDVEVRAPVAFNGTLANLDGWSLLLRRMIDVYADDAVDRHYVGLVLPPRGTEIGGLARVGTEEPGGFVPVSVATARPSLTTWAVAHELGHNWGRRHAPCSVPDPDPAYPYADGAIGVWGHDVFEGRSYPPAPTPDLMGYCAQDAWISDYTYAGVLGYRADHARFTEPPATEPARLLVVSGEVDGGAVALDAPFVVTRRATPVPPGAYELVAWDAAGRELGRASFGTFDTSLHGPEAFHLGVPLPGDEPLAGLRVLRGGVVLFEREVGLRPASVTPPSAIRLADGGVEVTWDAAAFAALWVRDGPGGAVLGHDEGAGRLRVWPTGTTLELLLSDGLNTRRSLVRF